MAEFSCFKCAQAIAWSAQTPVSRRDSCPKCGADVRVCLNCRHYDSTSKWECREHISERVADKERANLCDSFQAKETLGGARADSSRDAALKAAEALFKKG